jgi:purine-cytosine permease-like protein
MLGPLAYDLGFTDSALCCVFGTLLGSAGAGYMSTFGPESGNRTMVSCSRIYCSKVQTLIKSGVVLMTSAFRLLRGTLWAITRARSAVCSTW